MKLKIILITTMWVIAAYLMIYQKQIIQNFKYAYREAKWQKDAPQGTMINGMKNGEWRTYFKNGNIAEISNYINDTLHGPQIFNSPDGLTHARRNYHHGILADSFFLYHSNGKVNLEEFKDKKGKRQGVFRVYHRNGQLSQVGQNIDNKFDGEFKTFYESGKLKEIQYYTLGERRGTWVSFSEAGDTLTVERY